jgi:hypothetical protein
LAVEVFIMAKKKKEYVAPKMEVIDYAPETKLLAGSGDDPYWHKPDTPPGCQSAWWCGN